MTRYFAHTAAGNGLQALPATSEEKIETMVHCRADHQTETNLTQMVAREDQEMYIRNVHDGL
jgi:hypothetical protein